MPRLFILQVLYLIIAISFNIASMTNSAIGGRPFTSSNLYGGMTILCSIAVLVFVRERGFPRASAIIMSPMIAFMASSVFKHGGMAMDPDQVGNYAGAWSLFAAATINLYGTVVLGAGIVLGLARPGIWIKE